MLGVLARGWLAGIFGLSFFGGGILFLVTGVFSSSWDLGIGDEGYLGGMNGWLVGTGDGEGGGWVGMIPKLFFSSDGGGGPLYIQCNGVCVGETFLFLFFWRGFLDVSRRGVFYTTFFWEDSFLSLFGLGMPWGCEGKRVLDI